jgi:hypothetical protein
MQMQKESQKKAKKHKEKQNKNRTPQGGARWATLFEFIACGRVDVSKTHN